MPSIYQLKPAFQRLLRPAVRALAQRGVTANAVTLLAAGLSMAVGACIAAWPGKAWPLLLLPLFLFVRMAMNAIDGMLAREHAMQSRLGAVLNELGDVVSDAALYLPLALVPGLPPVLVVVIVALAIISEMAGVIALQVGARRRYDGPMGKSDRAVAFGALGLWLGLGGPTGAWLTVLLAVVALLAGLTIFNRSRGALHEGGRS